MSIILIAGLIATQTVDLTVEGRRDDMDVGYAQLVAGQPAAALERIEANRRIALEPAALLNKGTALAMLGKTAAARDSFREVAASRDQYDVELADGSWISSRVAAKRALALLERGQVLALK